MANVWLYSWFTCREIVICQIYGQTNFRQTDSNVQVGFWPNDSNDTKWVIETDINSGVVIVTAIHVHLESSPSQVKCVSMLGLTTTLVFVMMFVRSNSPEAPNSAPILVPCDHEIWWISLKNNKAPLLSHSKPCASFHRHMWIPTGVTVWKLGFDLCHIDHWPLTLSFCMVIILSMVITPENFMMIHTMRGILSKRCDGQRDGRKGGRTDWTIHRAAWSQLKSWIKMMSSANSRSRSEYHPLRSSLEESGSESKI